MDTVLDTSPAQRESVSDRIYLQLRSAVMNGEFSPFTRLSENKLAARYDASRTPIREAFSRLISDGLLVKRDGGLYPYMPSFQELANLYELRVTLEQQGLVRSIADPTVRHDTRALDTELRRWEDIADARRDPDASFVTEDELFHRTLLDASGNSALTTALDRVNARIRAVRMYDYLTDDRMTATVTEHMEILRLVLAGKLPAALEALRSHIGVSREVVMERAAKALTAAHMQALHGGEVR